MKYDYDVIVIGAGFAGLHAARLLAADGASSPLRAQLGIAPSAPVVLFAARFDAMDVKTKAENSYFSWFMAEAIRRYYQEKNWKRRAVYAEDPRFFQHGGVDIISLIRAAVTNVAMGGGGPGGSTITMQYVKNSLVEAANLSGNEQIGRAHV